MKKINKVRIQLQLILIWGFNLILSFLPTHILRILYLKIFGSKIGEGTSLHRGIYFTRPGRFEVGSYSTINFDCYLDTRGGIKIGNYVMIGHKCRIYTAGHNIDSVFFDGFIDGVTIGEYAVIFPNVQIMPGVKIGAGAVVLTGSVVAKDIPDNVVMGGNPCKFIRKRIINMNYKHDYKYWLPNV